MLETSPVGPHSVYVCTNISCSLRGADELYEAIRTAAAEDPDFNVRAFECLGACDIAPMASVDGVYVGPLSTDDVPQLMQDVRAGRPVLPDKQLARRPVADPDANRHAPEAG
jgi:NADH:ubiquinone oxidoreductase subunit E